MLKNKKGNEKEVGKIEKHKMLKDEIAIIWGKRKEIVIPVVVGGLGVYQLISKSMLQQLGWI